MSAAEAKLATLREQNRLRQARFYAINKVKVSEQRKARNTLAKEPKAPVVEPVAEPLAPRIRAKRPVKAPVAVPIVEPVAEPVAPRLRVKRPVKAPTAVSMTYEQAVIMINRSDQITTDGSRTIYKTHLKTILGFLKCDNVYTCFNDAPNTIKAIDEAKQIRDPTKGYSLLSKKTYVQTILKLSDVLSIPLSKETKEQYIDAFEAMKLDSNKQTDVRIEQGKKEEVMTYAKYIPLVKANYGQDSKEYLIARLYSVSGFRDDLQLRINLIHEHGEENQIIVPVKATAPVQIILHTYKTAGKYGMKTIDIPTDIAKEVRKYIKANKKMYNDYLFGDKPLTGFISKMNKGMGLDLTINNLRQMHVAPVIDNMSSAERVELAKKMNHAPATSAQYKQKRKKV